MTTQDWVDPDQWIRSTERSHEPLIDDETFERARTLMAAKGADTKRTVRSAKTDTPYLFTGMVRCGVCGRKMAGHRAAQRLGYRCRLRDQYALPDDTHPKSLFVSEHGLAIVTMDWLAELFAPENREQVLAELAASAVEPAPDLSQAASQLREAERRITKLVESISAGIVEPDEAQDTLSHLRAQRDAARAVIASAERQRRGLTVADISGVLDDFGGLVGIMASATKAEKLAVYQAARLGITYHPSRRAVTLGGGVSVRVGGANARLPTQRLRRSEALALW